MKVYKVVSKKFGRYYSALWRGYPDLTVEYKIDEESFPLLNGSLLFAFDNEQDAHSFALRMKESYDHYDCRTCVFESEAEIEQFILYSGSVLLGHDKSLDVVRRYWDGKYPLFIRGIIQPPSGTVFCKSITIQREVVSL